MYKYLITISFFIAILISSENLEHPFSSSINSYTKTPNEGRMFINVDLSNNKFLSRYDGGGDKTNLGVNYKYRKNNTTISAIYHGTKGAGYKFQVSSTKKTYENKDNNENFLTYSLGTYFLWNEMFGRLKPAVMDGYQYTFPSNRIITGLNFMSGEVLDDNDNKKTSQALGVSVAIDFIIGSKCILSNKLDAEVMDDDDLYDTVISSKMIYDFNENISIGTGLNYRLQDDGNIAVITIEGGYQLKDLKYGNFSSTIQINPYFQKSIFGENMDIYRPVIFPNNLNEMGLKLNILFN